MKDWRHARERMERDRYEEIDMMHRNGSISIGEAIAMKSRVPDEVREMVREAVAVSERGD